MIEINIHKLGKTYGFEKVLDNFNLELKTNEKIALIGTNGCGKSTLLKILAGNITPTSGNIAIRNGAKIGYMEQELKNIDKTVLEILYSKFPEVREIEQRLKKLETKLDKIENYNKYLKLQEKYMKLSGYVIEETIGKIIKTFNLSEILNKNYNILSGGQKKIVELASIMVTNPNILLLDEPTNHLDIKTLKFLEEYLKNYKGTILMVSHDRYFLDKVATKIVLIEKGHEEIFNGNYSYFLKENENRIMLEFKDYKDQQKQIKAMKDAIKKLREWGKLGDNERFFKRANNIEKQLERLEKLEKPLEKKFIPLNFNNTNKSSNEIIKLENFTIDNLFDNISILIRKKEHVCLMGENGSGKTTLVNQIMQEKYLGSNVKYGYIEQIIKFENEELTILDEAKKYFIGDINNLRSALNKFLFCGENVFKKIKALSGGEKVRLKLFCIIQNNCNLLILDEPTNHIDIDTREILENTLNEYNGTILFISHDRYFINKVAKKILLIKNKKIKEYIGNFDDFENNL